MFRKISLGNVGVVIGLILTIVGFWAYATDRPTLNLAGFFYGIPLLLGGLALKSAELEPVPMVPESSDDVIARREATATETQNQIRKDVTRFRYGEEAHLATALEYLGLSPTDEERPVLTTLREENHDGQYALVMLFESPMIGFDQWQEKQDKMSRFFGPNIQAELKQPEAKQVEVTLLSTQSA